MKHRFSEWLQQQWYKNGVWQLLLLPGSLIFWLLSSIRRWLYQLGILKSSKLPVPVIVVGNINVGGTGKTPLVIAIAEYLQGQGFHPGIISRGYGGSSDSILSVTATSDSSLVGDEPVLMARRAACPVWVGRQRPIVAQKLLESHPDCDLIISDDGLQHYQLARDIEIVVVDGLRGLGNAMLLPAGPLRESSSRLNKVNAVVVNGESSGFDGFLMKVEGSQFCNLKDAKLQWDAANMQHKKLHAMAGIGNPEKFFRHLESMGLKIERHVFPDHHRFSAEDMPTSTDVQIIMTEKDAVKCMRFATDNAWYLPIKAVLDESFFQLLMTKLRK